MSLPEIPGVHVEDLVPRLREVGRIRMGEKGPKGEPRKLTTWRLTSQWDDEVARYVPIYGGDVRKWEKPPTPAEQFELYTEVDTLNVILTDVSSLSIWREMWSAGGCVRRCTGTKNVITDGLCECPADHEERNALAKDGKACSLVTRLSVLLPAGSSLDVGAVWRVETRGYYAATELAGTMTLMSKALSRRRLVPARLRIDQRSVKRPNEPRRDFVVPVLELPDLDVGELLADSRSRSLEAVDERPELSAGAESSHGEVQAPSPPAPDILQAGDEHDAIKARIAALSDTEQMALNTFIEKQTVRRGGQRPDNRQVNAYLDSLQSTARAGSKT